jgi:hypothetical protein
VKVGFQCWQGSERKKKVEKKITWGRQHDSLGISGLHEVFDGVKFHVLGGMVTLKTG